MSRIRVGILFGGRSGEHEVSLASARSVLAALDRERFEPVPIGITREGQWLISDSPDALLGAEVSRDLPGAVEAVPDVTHHAIARVEPAGGRLQDAAIDVILPLLHGPQGEDGTVQGLFELAGLPYVGSGVLGSAQSMDKYAMKVQLGQAGLPQVPHRLIRSADWARNGAAILDRLETDLTYPLFIKPCNLGSSVGISKAVDRAQLESALHIAMRYDRRVLVEQGIDAREVECGVLGNDEPEVSVVGEVTSHHDWYDYEAKYTDGLAQLTIPAQLTPEQSDTVRCYARDAFLAVDAAGLARVDFFVRRGSGEVLINEINTMPGFTRTSMYPKLWEASGVSYPHLISRLIQLAFERHAEKQRHSDTH